MNKYYILGLDLGIASIGWCLYEGGEEYKYDKNGIISTDDENNPIVIHKPKRIMDLGSFIFNELEDNKGKTENKKRGECRRMRRQRRRKAHRLARLRKLFNEEFGIDFLNDVVANSKTFSAYTPFEIKIRGLDKALSKEELMIALYHYMKYRGFKSNRKAADAADKNNKALLSRLNETRSAFKKSNCRTITEYLYTKWLKRCENKDINNRFHNWTSNTDTYNMDVSRDMYLDEINKFLDKQIEFGVVNADFKEKYFSLYIEQRAFSEGPGFASPGEYSKYHVDFLRSRGKCIFDGKPRAIKDGITAKRFVLLSALNNFRYKDDIDVRYHGLTPAQIKKAEEKIIYEKDFTYSKLLKLLGLKNVEIKGLAISKKNYKSVLAAFLKDNKIQKVSDEFRPLFNKKIEEKKLNNVFFKGSELINKLHKSKNKEIKKLLLNDKFYDDIAEVLFANKDDDRIKNALKQMGYNEHIIDEILKMNIDCKQVILLSNEICGQLIPKMREGVTYDKALIELGYDHHGHDVEWNGLDGIPEIDRALEIINVTKINNPVVKNTLVNLRKVINALIKQYGHIDECVVELNRELKKSFTERQDIRNSQLENFEDNLEQKVQLLNKYPGFFLDVLSVSKEDLIRYRLFKEQSGVSPYTGIRINESRIFSSDYEIDHIMPYSRSFDDSFNNKVLVEKSKNQFKGNRLPYEVGEDLFYNVKKFLENNANFSKKKRDNLLRKEIPQEFQTRNLNDTSYITKIAKDLISFFVLKDKKCRTTNGIITSHLRKSLGLSGKTHTYAINGEGKQVSYENNLYQASYVSDYRFHSLTIFENKKTIQFELKKRIFVKGDIKELPFLVKFDKKEKKEGSNKDLSYEEIYFNYCIDDFAENYNLIFKKYFDNCVDKPINEITRLIKGLHITGNHNTGEYTRHLDATNRIIREVQLAIQKDIDVKNRENNLHHALDAAIIGIVTYSVYQNFSNANKRGLLNDLKFEEPYQDFRKEVLARVYERDRIKLIHILKKLAPYENNGEVFNDKEVHVMIPVRQTQTRIQGAISKETIYGVSKTDKNSTTKKISVQKIKEKDLEKIVDKDKGNKAVYSALVSWFQNNKPSAYPVLPQKGNYIKSVKIIDGETSNMVSLSTTGNRYAENSNVVRVEFYKKKGSNSKNIYAVPIYYYQIENQKRGLAVSYTIMWAQDSANAKCSCIIDSISLKRNYERIAILPRYSLVEVELKDGGKMAVYSGGVTRGSFEIYSLIGDFTDCEFELGRIATEGRMRVTISTIKSIKVRSISILGKVS